MFNDFARHQDLTKILNKMTIIVATHIFTYGPAEALADYLSIRVKSFLFIRNPFYYSKDVRSIISFFENGEKISEKCLFTFRSPEFVSYFKDLIVIILAVLASKKRANIFIGLDPLNGLVGLFLRKLGFVRKCVLYDIDYTPTRFKNTIINALYHSLGRFCALRVDWLWCISDRIAKVRRLQGVEENKIFTVPAGIDHRKLHKPAIEQIDINTLAFIGHIKESSGLELVINALPKIFKRGLKIRLIVVGDGPYKREIESLVKKLKLEQDVKFYGLLHHDEGLEIISRCGIGVAPYEPSLDSVSIYADPMKPKDYLACALPVIITRVPKIAQKIQKEGAGIAIRYDEEEFVDAVIKILSDKENYIKYKERAFGLAQEFLWNDIFNKVFIRMFYGNSTRSNRSGHKP